MLQVSPVATSTHLFVLFLLILYTLHTVAGSCYRQCTAETASTTSQVKSHLPYPDAISAATAYCFQNGCCQYAFISRRIILHHFFKLFSLPRKKQPCQNCCLSQAFPREIHTALAQILARLNLTCRNIVSHTPHLQRCALNSEDVFRHKRRESGKVQLDAHRMPKATK